MSSPTQPPQLVIRVEDVELTAVGGDLVEVDHVVAGALETPGVGQVLLDGQDVTGWSADRRARGGLVVLGGVAVAGEVSIRDHLLAVPGVDRHRVDEVLATAPLLAGRDQDPAGWLSGGERQVLGWLQTILVEPRVVLLDIAGRGLDGPTLVWAGDRARAWVAAGAVVLVHPGRPEEQAWLAGAATA